MKMAYRAAAIAGAALIIGGCATYYQVREPGGGRVYYTTDIDHIREGAVRFKDDKSGSDVTLQNSEVREIPKDEYLTGVSAPPANAAPAPAAAPAVSK